MIEWDENKRRKNFGKHGVDFASVERFDADTALMVEDTRFDYGETRYQALGFIDGVLHMLVYTPRDQALRVISLRRATRKECENYEQYIKSAAKTAPRL